MTGARLLTIAAVGAVMLSAAPPEVPDRFYIVSHARSDHLDYGNTTYLLDVWPTESGVRVRHLRAGSEPWCQGLSLKLRESHLQADLTDLLQGADLCGTEKLQAPTPKGRPSCHLSTGCPFGPGPGKLELSKQQQPGGTEWTSIRMPD